LLQKSTSEIIIIIIIIKAICNAQDHLKKAASALSGSEKMLLSIYDVSYEQQCLQLCPKDTAEDSLRKLIKFSHLSVER